MSNADSVRSQVSETYARAITTPKTGGCCGPSQAGSTCGSTAVLGYSPGEIATIPVEAATSSFGCGNPLAFNQVQEGQTVLDLGSGAGMDLLLAAKKVGPKGRAIGVDMTDEMIAAARKNITAAGAANAEVRKGIIENLPVENGTVDWVISNCVINLSPEKPKVFSEIARVLKSGGHFSISDIVVEDFPEALRSNVALYGACVAGAVSEKEYLAGLRAAGLEDVAIVEKTPYGADFIRSFLASAESPVPELGKNTAFVDEIANRFAAKVASIRVTGRKA
ncbi:MAG: arsenite methyltransferase [Bdellovibrionota bacterium]